MRRAAALALLLLVAGCGEVAGPLPALDLQIRLEAGARRVRPGQGFALDVVRTWRRGIEPSPWDDQLLSPLVVRAAGVSTREDARRIQETRHFRAYVFSLDDATVPAVPFAGMPQDGGELRIAAARPLRLRVEPEVDPKAPGPPELPADLPARPGAWWVLLAVVLALGGGAAFVLRRRAARDPTADAAPAVGPEVVALEALGQVGRGEPLGDVEAIAALVRVYAAARFGAAAAQTTEELAPIPGITAVLAPCDRAKFATHVPAAGERDQIRDAAERFVRSTTP